MSYVQVGDYVLSPEIVVERKALPDLFSSLGSGRLYHQAEAMTKSYKTPILLIEFDGDKAFALTGLSELSDSGGLDHRSPQARLVLLLLHFPKLRYALRSAFCASCGICLLIALLT
eukprot:GHUV01052782.1.p1 GENE.GHUV01052782.1~~GHUV01052782.1.p1  ORF type:complete len:116 (-),score=22.54 GHUV01052782.1:214-561(-)